ncbi:MAG: hypothetical protein MRY64_08310 [Hyphomonadaceae bacterium]|nr:hypothetical protein [Hyphomonadaceae bacterium]
MTDAQNSPAFVARKNIIPVLWGDDKAGYINDLYYSFNPELVSLVITMPPGARYGASEENRPIYNAIEGLYVLEGQYTIQNPETGEVRVANPGDMILMRGPQWHFGYNFSDSELRVLEMIAITGSQDGANTREIPQAPHGFDPQKLLDFPRETASAYQDMAVINERSAANILLGKTDIILLRALASTDSLSVGVCELSAGQRSDPLSWSAPTSLYVEFGRVHVRVKQSNIWQEMNVEDAFHIPAGIEWQVFNLSADRARLVVSAAGNFASILDVDSAA